MTVSKITSPITPNELIDKTNEIIDNLGGGGVAPVWGNITGTLSNQTDLQNALDAKYDASNPDGYITSADLPTNHVTTNTAQTISGDKKFTGVTRFQNGSGNGCVILGADVASTTVSPYTRKLGRMSFHTFKNTVDCAFVSTDSDDFQNHVEFGGRIGDVTNTSPDVLKFTVAKVHNSTANDNKVNALEVSYSGGANFGVQPKYNNKNLATEAWVSNQIANAGYISTTTTKNVSVAGNTKDVAKTNPETLYVPNGLIMGGTAAEAGLVTRGLCGVSKPSSTGACNKEHLYINFDNTTTFNTGRQLILQAGEVGTHYGNNLYQFAVPRGDIIKNYCDNHYITTSALTPYALSADLASVATSGDYDDLINKPTIPTVNNGTLTIQKNGTTIGTFTANQSGNSTVNIEADTVLTDDTTVNKNSDDELQAIGVIDDNTGNAIKTWTGTKAQYDAIVTKDSDTIYNVEDTTSPIVDILNTLYPIGAIYIGTMATCPLSVLGVGTWQLVAQDRVLQGAGTRGAVGSEIDESLPNIKGYFADNITGANGTNITGAFYSSGTYPNAPDGNAGSNNGKYVYMNLDASRSSSSYQDNAPVQQDGYLVNIWERTA